jgi:copper chaperone NosL
MRSHAIILTLVAVSAIARLAGAEAPPKPPKVEVKAEVKAEAEAKAASVTVPAPKPRDACAVCGMFVFDFPEWVATVVFDDGAAFHFDGAKDLFDFLADVGRYAKGRTRAGIATIAVTDYYEVRRIAAKDAFYVLGSNVKGPMGPELVPVATRAAAEELMRDHDGKRILRFDEVTPAVLKSLDPPR